MRAAAYILHDAPEWAGSQQLQVVFERRATPNMTAGEGLVLPFEPLEEALQAVQRGQGALQVLQELSSVLNLPPRWLADLEPLYDPAQVLGHLRGLIIPDEEWQRHRLELLQAGRQRLQAAQSRRSAQAPLEGLLLARQLALDAVYPALAAAQGKWPADGARLTHHWRAELSLAAPRALELLESLYGFGGSPEARRLLGALRGMGMLAQERTARLALQHGYADGATRFIRDETALQHAADLKRWNMLPPARRERLSLLLGLERSPLGARALEVVTELLQLAAQP